MATDNLSPKCLSNKYCVKLDVFSDKLQYIAFYLNPLLRVAARALIS